MLAQLCLVCCLFQAAGSAEVLVLFLADLVASVDIGRPKMCVHWVRRGLSSY